MNTQATHNSMSESDVRRLEAMKMCIRTIIAERFDDNATKFSSFVGIDHKSLSALLVGRVKKAPRADFVWHIFEKFPDVTPAVLFGFSSTLISNILEERQTEYSKIVNKRNENEQLTLLRAQLDYMRSLYENTLEKLILLQNSLKRE